MVIVPAEIRHIPSILKLLGQVGEVHHQIRPDIFGSGALKYGEKELEALLQDPDRPIFIAETDEVVGYCFCVRKSTPGSDLLVARQELYIDDLCVDETKRRMGIARALYDHALAYAKGLNCHSLTLNVWCGNDGAQKFYEEMGMRPRNIMMEYRLEDSPC